MIKAKQAFFRTSNLECYSFHCNKATILYFTLEYFSLSVLSVKLFFLNLTSTSKVMVIEMYGDENFELKFSRVKSLLKIRSNE